VTTSEVFSAAAARGARVEVWLNDLHWHRRMFREARFRWSGEDVMAIITRYTGGQLSFTTVHHLELLQRYQLQLGEYSSQVRNAMAEPLQLANESLGGEWVPTSDALRMSVVDCKATTWFAIGVTPEERTNVNVKRVLHGLPFANPLIEAWELKQLWRLYETAVDLLEDTICDLVDELRPTRPVDVLVAATDTRNESGLIQRVNYARELRGGPEDGRPVPAQIF